MANYSEELVKYIKELLPVLNYCVVNPVTYKSTHFNPTGHYKHRLTFTNVIMGYEVIIEVKSYMSNWTFNIDTADSLEEVKKNLKEKIDEDRRINNENNN